MANFYPGPWSIKVKRVHEGVQAWYKPALFRLVNSWGGYFGFSFPYGENEVRQNCVLASFAPVLFEAVNSAKMSTSIDIPKTTDVYWNLFPVLKNGKVFTGNVLLRDSSSNTIAAFPFDTPRRQATAILIAAAPEMRMAVDAFYSTSLSSHLTAEATDSATLTAKEYAELHDWPFLGERWSFNKLGDLIS